ncbi:cysteine desulfurase [Arcobacteraceae bacterium]|nr:cysteine desulfurase [Arcobacteraceae bacterium]
MSYKKFFPYFKNSDITYLDSGATTQKVQSVIASELEYYTDYCANTHRSNFGDANKATIHYEESRKYLQKFINAKDSSEIIFTKGVTESINFICSSFAKNFKTVIISSLEHHSNIVPWHMQGRSLGDGLEVVGYKDNFAFDFDEFERILVKNPNSFVSVTHISNAFGTINDIKKICAMAHKYDSYVLIDGAQSLAHKKIDIQDIDCDFFAISGHKTFAPTGVGAVYIKQELLNRVEPYQTGGATIKTVTYNSSTLLDSPYKFEAGTQNIAGVIGFRKALEFIDEVGYEIIEKQEYRLYEYLHNELKKISEVVFYNTTKETISNKSFNIQGVIHDDVGILLDKQKIAIRVGHHCAMPIMEKLEIKGTIRVSLAFYNDFDDIDIFIVALKRAIKMLKD